MCLLAGTLVRVRFVQNAGCTPKSHNPAQYSACDCHSQQRPLWHACPCGLSWLGMSRQRGKDQLKEIHTQQNHHARVMFSPAGVEQSCREGWTSATATVS